MTKTKTNKNFEIMTEYSDMYPVKLKKSEIHLRGVFATQDIKKDSLIERCPLIPLSNRSRYQIDKTIWDYCYANTNCNCEECSKHGYVLYLMGGYGMLYNHRDNSNCKWDFNYRELYADLLATQDISSNTEIVVNYGDFYWKTRETTNAENN